MNDRERALAVLRYEKCDRLPVVHFGFWGETLQKWAEEGHLTADEAKNWGDGNPTDAVISRKLGFDFNWYSTFSPAAGLWPAFERKVIREFPDGMRHERDGDGVIVVVKPGAHSIPAEIEHTLKDRASWEEHYKQRLQWTPERITQAQVRVNDRMVRFSEGGLDFLRSQPRDYAYGLHCGSLYGNIRNMLGMEGACYLMMDDEPLFDEIIATVGEVCFQNVKYALASGAKFDFGHFWEDICFKNGPLITPSVFAEKVGPQYKRITDLLKQHGIDIVSLDCDGLIDALIPTWFENGVNTMFPIEVGTWDANIRPWRAKYGRNLRGMGGMNKTVFAHDRAAIDAEVARLKPLVELGGLHSLSRPPHRAGCQMGPGAILLSAHAGSFPVARRATTYSPIPADKV